MDTSDPLPPAPLAATSSSADRPAATTTHARQQLSQQTQTDLTERVATGSERIGVTGSDELAAESDSNGSSGGGSSREMLPREMLGR
jgi:hypothetical protein